MIFRRTKALHSSRLVWGCPEPRPVWVENGVCLHVLSRSEGMETVSCVSVFHNVFSCLHVLSRSEGIETVLLSLIL